MHITSAVDILYKNFKGPITIVDQGKQTATTIEWKGYQDLVVWNPSGDESMGYDKFVCVEPVQSVPITFPAGKFQETKVRDFTKSSTQK